MESFRKPLDSPISREQLRHGPEVEEKIEHICQLMRDCQFRTGNTSKDLAKEWGLSLSYVIGLTCEASRRVRSETMDPDHAAVVVGTYLESALRAALTRTPPDLRVIAQLCQVYANASGVGGTQKLDIELKDAATPAKARDLIKSLFRGDVGPKGEGSGGEST